MIAQTSAGAAPYKPAKKRKNIDLPEIAWQKLGLLAVSEGISLKAFVEKTLERMANRVEITVHENPSPSNDPWYDVPENVEMVMQASEEVKKYGGKVYTLDQIKEKLGL